MSDIANKVETLMEAMPYLQKYAGKTVVIKYGGNAMINEQLKDAVMHDVVLLKLLGMRPVLSHGGGPGINKMLETLNIPVQFINGLRYTSEDTMRVVEAVLVGQVNTELVGFINKLGGKAVGLSGIDGGMIKAVFFGNVIAVLGCYYGLHSPAGAEGVGKATTRTVVASIIVIFILNAALTFILF